MIEFFKEYWAYLKARKKWVFLPVLFMLILLGFLIVFGGGGAASTFIYTLF